MKLSELKLALSSLKQIRFELPTGEFVPDYFHVTEVGLVTKNFIDCGGVIREEKRISMQLWYANDTQHRLKPSKLLSIIQLSENNIQLHDVAIELEYQAETIGKYGLTFNGQHFKLSNKQTACLATDICGIPTEKTTLKVADLTSLEKSVCNPTNGCC